MAITLEKAKLYLKIDGTDDDALLTDCINAAKAYLIGAVSDFDTSYEKYDDFREIADQLMYDLIAEYYTNRDARNDSRANLNYMKQSMMTQLQNYAAGGTT
ncbi:phage gp6-like head-tail connector protein [Selenomonas sp. WCA-380-WT-3B 3/]|uniref:Phage gp6-like head-tail connector protein n=1 Tax=Selenomonas montiformis TaxID=2652285 RepID=A0A6I2UYD2_9FIRM|nr:head-tail connector protein [Selenomonas montiformis]MSV24222.1 phage gp6-like head-tail connector protein [Selenomonas montiformis]